jgi:D-alanyl-D-alanine dipeptidase
MRLPIPSTPTFFLLQPLSGARDKKAEKYGVFMDYMKAIPIAKDYDSSFVSYAPADCPFTEITDSDRIIIDMQYRKQKVPGAVSRCFLRRDVAKRLLNAAALLPDGLKFLIYDVWRPLSVQKFLYDENREAIAKRYAHLSGNALEQVISTFVSVPAEDRFHPPAHTTGGAIDLTLAYENSTPLPMGSAFDAFDDSSHTRFYEQSIEKDIKHNRRLLYHVMTEAGFTNLPTEWWHFDYGTCFWSFYTGKPSVYTGAFTEDEVTAKLQEL